MMVNPKEFPLSVVVGQQEVTLWIPVLNNPKQVHEPGELYTKKIYTTNIPTPTVDQVVLFHDKELSDPDLGPFWECRRRYMDLRGRWHLELNVMVIDPVEINREYFAYKQGFTVWDTDLDGDPIVNMLRSEWVRYE